jgi:chromosome segregation ATPase
MGGKKEKSEFEKMGELGKGIEKGEESKEDIIKEIENFDATKTEKEEKTEKDNEEDEVKKLKEELKKEREKSKSLASILEKLPNASEGGENMEIENKLKAMESKINERINSQMDEVRNAINAMTAKIEEISKSEKSEKVGSKVKDMIDQVQADTSKKIADLQEEIRKLIERFEQPKKEEEVAKGLAVFGGRVDIKNEILEIRSALKDQEKSLHELREEMDTRITRLREQIKILERIPVLEERLEGLMERLGPANIEKLKKFVFSADEITGEVIPNEIEKRLTKELTPVFNDIKGVRDELERFNEDMKTVFNEINYLKNELKNVYKLGDRISQLQEEKDKIHEKIKEKETNLLALTNRLEALIKKRTEMLNDQIIKFDKIFTQKIEAKTKEFFDNLTEEKFLELEDRTEKNLAVARAKVNDMLSKFVQFQNVVNPTLTILKEELEKMDTKIEKIKVNQMEFQKELENKAKDIFINIALPQINSLKSDMAKFTKETKGTIEDMEAEFVQFQNVVNPTLTLLKNEISRLDTKIDKLKGRSEEMKEDMKALTEFNKKIENINEWIKGNEAKEKEFEKRLLKLENSINALMKEFDTIVKQTIADKKKFEEESRKQKERINILLKELRGE